METQTHGDGFCTTTFIITLFKKPSKERKRSLDEMRGIREQSLTIADEFSKH